MSTCHIKKVNLLEASRHHSTPSATLNTTEISLNNANLESYKKALHNIVRRLNKTPSVSSNKTVLRRSESKLNQSQQTMYQTTHSQHNSNKKHHVSSNSVSKNPSIPKRSQSNDGSAYKPSKDLLNKSMQEQYMRKESLSSNMLKSVSIQKPEKTEPQELDDIIEEKGSKGRESYGYDAGVNSTILQEVNINNFDVDGDRKLKDLLHKFQLRDAVHRQEIIKLKKANDLLRSHVKDLEKEIDRSNQTKDLEKKYTQKLESDLSNLKEKIRIESAEKKTSSQTALENKENKYLKIIDELKVQVTNLNGEKKLVEQLLKNSLQQNEMSKENNRSDKKSNGSVLHSVENSKNNTSASKPNPAGRIKTDNYMIKKKTEVETYEDETDPSLLASSIQPLNTSFLGINSKMSRDEKLKEIKDTNMSMNFDKITKMLNEGNTFTTLITDESDEPFPNKVSPPKLNSKSLKERMDMNQFRLDLTRLSKNRKID